MFGHDFIFQDCFTDAIMHLPKDQQLYAFWAIANYGTLGIIPDEDQKGEPYMAVFALAKRLIDESE